MLKALAARDVPIPPHIDVYLLDKEIEASDMTALEAVMAVDEEKVREGALPGTQRSQAPSAFPGFWKWGEGGLGPCHRSVAARAAVAPVHGIRQRPNTRSPATYPATALAAFLSGKPCQGSPGHALPFHTRVSYAVHLCPRTPFRPPLPQMPPRTPPFLRPPFSAPQTRLEQEAEFLATLEMTDDVEQRLSDVYER